MPPALLTAVDSSYHVHLIVGSNPVAAARCSRSLDVGALPKLIAPATTNLHHGIQIRVDAGEVEWLQRGFQDDDLTSLGRESVDRVVDAVFVTLGATHPQSIHISNLCRRLRIPINVTDAPLLSTFTLLSTHSDGPLQIGVTTSGRGCKLASRIRREIASTLPSGLGDAVSRLGTLRARLIREDRVSTQAQADELDAGDEAPQPATFNRLISPQDKDAAKTRRMRWLLQICEYWPLNRLCSITDDDIELTLSRGQLSGGEPVLPVHFNSQCSNIPPTKRGRIILAGAGPGSPELLTAATHSALRSSDIILADKLVPTPVLDLIPRRTALHIARKFPGNADAAQEELLLLGLAGLLDGKTVLRLKQGDPYLFGRGGEEVVWFRDRGFEPIVLPGITSALSAPLFAHIPVTQRCVADQVLICTGMGRAGQAPLPPEYVESRTVVFLMALHRLRSLVASLTGNLDIGLTAERADASHIPLSSPLWPTMTPCAVVERASCRDQRVIRSTLENICLAIDELGSQPPGLLVVGKACHVLHCLRKRWEVEEGLHNNVDWVSDWQMSAVSNAYEP